MFVHIFSFIIQLVCRRTPLVTVTLICFQLLFSQGCFSSFGCVHWHDVYTVAVQPRVHGIEMYPVAVQPRMHFQLLSGTLLLFHQVYTVLAWCIKWGIGTLDQATTLHIIICGILSTSNNLNISKSLPEVFLFVTSLPARVSIITGFGDDGQRNWFWSMLTSPALQLSVWIPSHACGWSVLFMFAEDFAIDDIR